MALPPVPPFEPRHGEAVPAAPGVVRVTANNPGPFTGPGTNSYVVEGKAEGDALAIVDPGPEDAAHYDALMRSIGGRPVAAILVTHTHVDHSPLARRMAEATGAAVLAEGPHRAARPLHEGERNAMDASADLDFIPDRRLADGERVEVGGRGFTAVHTPGHTANHCAFALDGGPLFAGDHVMAWATTIVAPPDGSMADYMASLDALLARQERGLDALLLPGHGAAVERPRAYVRALKAHRLMRERAVLNRVRAGDRRIADMVAVIYRTTDRRLHGAAALSVLAQLEGLVERGVVVADGPPSLDAAFRPA